MALYINNFRGRAGRKEQAKQLVREFENVEAAFARLQALNIATYLTIYENTTLLTGVVTVSPDNGFLQELTLSNNITLQIAAPLNETQYRISLLIHGGGYTVTNGWGAQTWKEYGLDNWWELFTAEGKYASMLLDFYWDRCSQTWICVAASKNQFFYLEGDTIQRLYPFHHDLTNVSGDDTMGFSRGSFGMTLDYNQAYHYLTSNLPRFNGIRYIENWVGSASDLTTVEWVETDVTTGTVVGGGPASEDVTSVTFDATGGKLAKFILPSFGRASTSADSIKLAVSFRGKMASGSGAVRVRAAFMGKSTLDPPVHDTVQVSMDSSWDLYGCILDITKDGNANTSMALDRASARALIEVAFVSPSGSQGSTVHLTDVQVEVLRGSDVETVSPERMDGTLGASMTLSATGTGTWVNATKTLTLASVGQYVDLSPSLVIGVTYLVHLRLQSGDAADIRMQNEVTVWAAGDPTDELYLQDAPFTFQYDGGQLKFVLMAGGSSVYLVDIYPVTGNKGLDGYQNLTTIGSNGQLTNATTDISVPLSSGILDGVAREIASENLIPYQFYRTFSAWDSVGLSGINANDCKNPVYQSEYGIDQWPARATIVQGASRVVDGFIQRVFIIPAAPTTYDFQIWIRRSIDVSGNQIVTPQHNDVTVPVSRYVDFEAELIGGLSTVGGNRVRLDLQTATFDTEEDSTYGLGIFAWENWYQVVLSLDNDGSHDGFRVRIYPASGNTPSATDINVEQQGWVIIDWAQFEAEGGTFGASSPVVGGETRAIENFTSALADGDYYLTAGMVHIAQLVSNNVVWDNDDGVYKDVLYSTVPLIPDIVPRNMHEFGLVEPVEPPPPPLTYVTTTLYPVEVVDAMTMRLEISDGYLLQVPEEALDYTVGMWDGALTQILLTAPTQDEAFDYQLNMDSGSLVQILLTAPTQDEALDYGVNMSDGELIFRLVNGYHPDEGLLLGMSVVGGDLTPI